MGGLNTSGRKFNTYNTHLFVHFALPYTSFCVFTQGARVWVREKEQLLPATVSSCGDGTLVVTTDYGEVRNVYTYTLLKSVFL